MEGRGPAVGLPGSQLWPFKLKSSTLLQPLQPCEDVEGNTVRPSPFFHQKGFCASGQSCFHHCRLPRIRLASSGSMLGIGAVVQPHLSLREPTLQPGGHSGRPHPSLREPALQPGGHSEDPSCADAGGVQHTLAPQNRCPWVLDARLLPTPAPPACTKEVCV